MSKTLDAWYKEHDITNAKTIKTAISVNNRDFPTSYDDVILGTRIAVFECDFPLLSDMETAITESKKAFRTLYSEKAANFIELFFSIFKFFPLAAVNKLGEDMLGGVDLVISNVPFSEQKWIFLGKEVTKRAFWAHGSHQLGLFVTPVTYEDKLRVNFCAHRKMKMSAQNLVSQFEKIINEDIALMKKNE